MDLNRNKEDIRWKQRFQNFRRAFSHLRSISERKENINEFSDEELELVVKRFEITFELAWKTLKDYIEYLGVELSNAAPRTIIKECAAHGIFDEGEIDGQLFIDMLEARNITAHTYDYEKFKKIAVDIAGIYVQELGGLNFYLLSKLMKEQE